MSREAREARIAELEKEFSTLLREREREYELLVRGRSALEALDRRIELVDARLGEARAWRDVELPPLSTTREEKKQ